MSLISEQYLSDLQDEAGARIHEIVGQVVELKKTGQNYTGLCCFHDEKTPSMQVRPSTGSFKCFGCAAGGGAIQFVSRYYNLPFPDAVRRTAEILSFRPVEYEEAGSKDSAGRSWADKAREALNHAAKVFTAQLGQSPEVIQHLKSRGVTGDDTRRFLIGCAPEDFNFIPRLLIPKVGLGPLKAAGLVAWKEDKPKRVWDFFRNRVTFGVRDVAGNIVGFAGRTLVADPVAAKRVGKYVNTPDTILFHKSDLLFGLYESLQVKSPEPSTINMVEGYMDVLACHRHDMTNTVAPMGTAVTGGQIERAFRYASHVRFIFDGDDAGFNAAYKAVVQALPYIKPGYDASVVLLPMGEDPDSLLLKPGGVDAFHQRLGQAKPAAKFLLDYLSALATTAGADGKMRITAEAKRLSELIKDDDFRSIFLMETRVALGAIAPVVAQPQSFVSDAIRSSPSAEALLCQIDAQALQIVNQASPKIVAMCGLLLREPAWLDLIDPTTLPDLSQAEEDVIAFTMETLRLTSAPDVTIENAYGNHLRYLVQYLMLLSGESTKDQITIVSQVLNTNNQSSQKKTTETCKQGSA